MNNDQAIKMYKDMSRIRVFEEIVRDRFADGTISGSVHLYIGEEAVAVGACAAINSDDYITSTHRGHGHVLAKGADPKKMMAELFAKETGYNKGRGGSMHLAAPEIGVLGANGIVGGGLPLAAGAALASKMRGDGKVCLCFFGDGGSNQGTFHESINISASYDLPCVYICENNLYAGGVKQFYDGVYKNDGMDYPRKVEDIADRAKGYDIPGVVVDGNDVIAVYEAVKKAVEYARAGNGPTLIECKTYRWRTHFEVEPDTYREPNEVEAWKSKCPIKRFMEYLLGKGLINERDVAAIEKNVQEEMSEAVRYGLESPIPDLEETINDVYAI